MDDSSEDTTENTNTPNNSENSGNGTSCPGNGTSNTSLCPGTWLIVVVLLITAAAIAVAAFAVYQWRRCTNVSAMSVAVGELGMDMPYNAIYQRGMRAMGRTPAYMSDLPQFD
jgi:hypothetical protein